MGCKSCESQHKFKNEKMKSKIIANRFWRGTVKIDKSDLKWRVSAYGLLFQQSKILLCENQLNHQFVLPGGAVELGESIVDALIREFKEETGINIQIIQFLGFKERFFHFDPTHETFQSLQLFFEVKSISTTEPRKDDIETPIWLDINTILSDRQQILQPHLEMIREHLLINPTSI